jgi:hypothetical protein
MITNPIEIEIIKKAKQPNIANPNRSELPFVNIKRDFLKNFNFTNKKVIDLGPGQFDFFNCLDAAENVNLYAIDNDDAVIELGEYRKYSMTKGNLKLIHTYKNNIKYDFIFCKFSINAFWFFDDSRKHENYINYLSSMLTENGSSWIAPWNGLSKNLDETKDKKIITETLNNQIYFFESNGFKTINANNNEIKMYGLTGKVMNNPIFIKNL